GATTLLVLWAWVRRDIAVRYAVEALEPPRHAIRDEAVFRAAFPLLGLLLLAYFVTGPLGVPIAGVTGAAAVALMAIAGRWGRGGRGATVQLSKVLRGAPWQI
ncbi:arsenical efflux pump membrane protein ArsB, partial [Streptococcus salivarius]|nr:arsenical efflux pump membrane protein ArsB [Streptococcus salivarius]